MRTIRSISAMAIAIGALAASTVGVRGQGDQAPRPPTEFSGHIECGPEVSHGTDRRESFETGDGQVVRVTSRGWAWQPYQTTMSDPRLQGTYQLAYDSDQVTRAGTSGAAVGSGTWRIVNDDGAWQGSFPIDRVPRPHHDGHDPARRIGHLRRPHGHLGVAARCERLFLGGAGRHRRGRVAGGTRAGRRQVGPSWPRVDGTCRHDSHHTRRRGRRRGRLHYPGPSVSGNGVCSRGSSAGWEVTDGGAPPADPKGASMEERCVRHLARHVQPSSGDETPEGASNPALKACSLWSPRRCRPPVAIIRTAAPPSTPEPGTRPRPGRCGGAGRTATRSVPCGPSGPPVPAGSGCSAPDA